MSLPICIKSQLQIHSTTVRINHILTIDEQYEASSEITSLVGCTELTLDRDCDIPYIQVTSARFATSLNSLRQEHRSFQQPNGIEVRWSILKSNLRSDYIDLSRARYIIQTLTYQESNSTVSELFYTIGYITHNITIFHRDRPSLSSSCSPSPISNSPGPYQPSCRQTLTCTRAVISREGKSYKGEKIGGWLRGEGIRWMWLIFIRKFPPPRSSSL